MFRSCNACMRACVYGRPMNHRMPAVMLNLHESYSRAYSLLLEATSAYVSEPTNKYRRVSLASTDNLIRTFETVHLPPRRIPLATVSNLTRPLYRSTPPASSQRCRFLHWLTSNASSLWQPSAMASTPTPVTRTQPRTERARSSSRCRPMLRNDESETAEPQKERLSLCRLGQPRARTSVAVSERAQQKD